MCSTEGHLTSSTSFSTLTTSIPVRRHQLRLADGVPPTGKSVDVLGLHMGRLSDDGRPIEHWIGNEMMMMMMMQQLGLAPSMDAPAGA